MEELLISLKVELGLMVKMEKSNHSLQITFHLLVSKLTVIMHGLLMAVQLLAKKSKEKSLMSLDGQINMFNHLLKTIFLHLAKVNMVLNFRGTQMVGIPKLNH